LKVSRGGDIIECYLDSSQKNSRHPREGGDPFLPVNSQWIPAFAGMTIQGRRRHALS
jgi:hypothetical protein